MTLTKVHIVVQSFFLLLLYNELVFLDGRMWGAWRKEGGGGGRKVEMGGKSTGKRSD
jgi:hypothetical protein